MAALPTEWPHRPRISVQTETNSSIETLRGQEVLIVNPSVPLKPFASEQHALALVYKYPALLCSRINSVVSNLIEKMAHDG